MNKTIIVTDSNSGIKQSEAEKLGICVIPMPFTINDEEYLEEISISQEQFYDFLKQDADVKTSQPSQYYLEELWNKLLQDYNEILYIPMTSGLSGTCENAKRLAEHYNGKVHVVDNKRISIMQKESIFEAIQMVKLNKSAVEIKQYLEETRYKNKAYITMTSLKYLKKGGRISPAAAALGSMLNVKPILFTQGENFEKCGIALALGQAKKKMIQQIKQDLETDFKEEYEKGKMTISIAHTQNFEEAERFKQQIVTEIPNVSFRFIDPLSLSVACHIGPGALAVGVSVNNYLN